MKKLLESASDPFFNSFQTKVDSTALENDGMMRKCAGGLVDLCIKINQKEGQPQEIDRNAFIKLIVNKFPGSLKYIVDLSRRKASQRQVNREELSHDQRDWHIIFYAGLPNVYFVTHENQLLELKLDNVLRDRKSVV